MVKKLLWRPLTFWDEEQIAFIEKEEQKIKKYENKTSYELKEKYRMIEFRIWDIELDIHYHEDEIRNLELKKDDLEEKIKIIWEILKERQERIF